MRSVAATPRRSSPSLWGRLTEPSPAVVDPSDRRTARLLSALLLFVVPLALLSFGWQLVAGDRPAGVLVAILVAAGLIAAAYAISRTRHYRVAGAITTLTPTAAGLQVVAADPNDPGWFAFMALGPALATLLLPLRWAIALAAANLLAVVGAVVSIDELDADTAIVALMFNAIMASVLLTAAAFRNRLERMRRADLVALQRLHESILEGTFGGMAVVQHGAIIEVNQLFSDLFGGRDDLIGSTVGDLFRGASLDDLVRIGEQREGRSAELVAARPDGSTFDAEVVVRRSGVGDAAFVVAVRDITDRKRADQALLHAQRMESVGRLADGIAHDTNNELFVISAHADELHRERAAAGQSVDRVVSIQEATARVATLIRRMLVFGRDRSSAPTLVDVASFVHDACPMWRQVLGSGIELRCGGDGEAGRVRIDRAWLEQLLLNLVLNARDAMDGRGVVHVDVSGVTVERSFVLAGVELPAGPYQRITVVDAGGGIAPADLPLVFDAFFTTKPHGLGTGLGLYTSREIVRSAGGAITVESDDDGTTVTVFLPVVPSDAPSPAGVAEDRPA